MQRSVLMNRRRLVVTSVLALAWVGACSNGDAPERAPAPSSPVSPAATTSAEASTAPAHTAGPSPRSPNAAEAPSYVEPTGPAPRRAGPLDRELLPAADIFGAEWTPDADPGGSEAGWIGNGTFAHGRNAHEAAFGVLPLGCQRRLDLALPVPDHALQGSYHSASAKPAQVVVLQFGSTADAATYFSGLRAMLLACVRPDGPTGVSFTATTSGPSFLVGARHYGQGGAWSEVDVRAADRVAVLLSSAAIPRPRGVVPTLQAAISAG